MRIKFVLLLAAFFFSCSCVSGQGEQLKVQALTAFKAENYPLAIQLLEKAATLSPADPEVFYYLGFFTHYAAYDSRPLAGYNSDYSEKIFRYLEKAIALKPDYGDAKYFYGAECSANIFLCMQRYDAAGIKRYAQKAFDIGAYPLWLTEWGRNFLNTLEPNAIVFTGGNSDFDICTYLQLCQNVRTDVTVLPIGNIDRPWYVAFINKGLNNAVRSVILKLSEEQIDEIRPYKWRTQTLHVAVSDTLKKKYKLTNGYTLDWLLEPDFTSERMHSKIEGDSAIKRTYLSPQRAILAHIIEHNYAQRPIYFSNLSLPFFSAGLMPAYTQRCGLVSKLLPIKVENTPLAVNYAALASMLRPEKLKDYKDIVKTGIPRIRFMTDWYFSSVVALGKHYQRSGEKEKLRELISLFNQYLKVGYDTEYENEVAAALMGK